MPEISRFYGIVITMYWNDHPPPHFHARHGDDEALIEIETLQIYEGRLKPTALRLVQQWAAEHHEELRANWQRARRPDPLAAHRAA